jgi:hypothetical protein
MRNTFIETQSVKRFEVMIHTLLTQPVGIDRFGLLYGDPGLGKSEAAMWLLNHLSIDGVFIRVVKIMSTRWLLEELVCALGLDPAFRAKDLFDQAKEALTGTDRLVIFDEIDYLTHDSKVIETIHDLGDLTNAPFVFIGMHQADKKLRRYRHLWRRFSQVIHFEPLGREDVSAVLKGVCEIKVDESVIDAVFETPSLTISLIYRWAQKIEGIARSRGLGKVSADDLFNRDQKNYGSKTNQHPIRFSA